MRDLPPPDLEPAGVYLHFPFCSIRCSYCDFPTVAGQDERIEAYLGALQREISSFQLDAPRCVDSLFLGGGTPSRMTPDQVARVGGAVAERFDLLPDAEITLEGNPESLSPERLAGYRAAGVTRISVGVQSVDDAVLRSVGRAHDAREAERAVRDARDAGFESVGVDLILGLPGERLPHWGSTVARVLSWGADHLSIYLLETDKDTPLARAVRHGRVILADDEGLLDAWDAQLAAVGRAGLEAYEISNFARPGHASRHNLKYWSDVGYAAFGLGAHAYFGGARRANRRDLPGYLEAVESGRDPVAERTPWDARARLEEALILGLRRVDGVDLLELGERYACDVERRYAAAWERGAAAGLIDRDGRKVRLTAGGRLRSNELFSELIGV
jgi:oxygen-independent coproporphyrinogen-3 oxidase